MAKFKIEAHFRLQEWVAEEKGYFRDEGLDYEFREQLNSKEGKQHDLGGKVGADSGIVDHELLPEPLRQPRTYQTRQDVGKATRKDADD